MQSHWTKRVTAEEANKKAIGCPEDIRNAEIESGKKPQQQKENSQRYRKQTRDNAGRDANCKWNRRAIQEEPLIDDSCDLGPRRIMRNEFLQQGQRY
jgi:hypothetical protein